MIVRKKGLINMKGGIIMENSNVLVTVLVALLIFLGGNLMGSSLYSDTEVVTVEKPIITEKLVPFENLTIPHDPRLEEVYDEILKEEVAEDLAEELALEEMDTRDFKDSLTSFLEKHVPELEDIDHRDVLSYSIRDVDVDLDGDEAVVLVEFNAYIANYGDEEEEEKARIKVVFIVVDLDDEEDYEDAEVEEFGKFDLIRFYD